MEKITDALQQMREEIKILKKDRDSYKARTGHSEKFLYYKNQQILVFESILLTFEDYADEVCTETIQRNKEFALKDQDIWKLEGICLFHGIHDVAYYRSLSKYQITDMVLEAWQEGWRQKPSAFLDKPVENIRKVDKPIYDFTQLLNAAERSR